MLFAIIVFATLLTYLLPAGLFERELIQGRQRVVPGSYKLIPSSPVSFMDMFRAFSLGFKSASDIIFIVFASGAMFGVLEKTKMVENVIGSLVNKLGLDRKYLMVIVLTYVFGTIGVAVGYENNIALIPIAALITLAIGGDLVLAAGISIAAITVGFGLSPINPYTIGTGHKIAELPMFSGAILRSILCFIALSYLAYYNVRYFKKIIANPQTSLAQGIDLKGLKLTKALSDYKITSSDLMVLFVFLFGMAVMLFGIFNWNWYLKDISSIFIIITIACAIVARMNPNALGETILKALAMVAPGAFMVGYASTIKEILILGQINDSIAFYLSNAISGFPNYVAAIIMSMSQCIMNIMIPSGSGQALATLPVMIPVGELTGLTRQCSILAFQIGDGVTNLFNPALGGLIAMLSLCRVPFDRWLRFIFPLAMTILCIAWIFLLIAVLIGYN